MPVRVKLYILAGFLIQPSLKYYDSDFINMQFSCQRNSDLIELPCHQVISRESESFVGEVGVDHAYNNEKTDVLKD